MFKRCSNCKHKTVGEDKEPCISCRCNWVAEPIDKNDCYTIITHFGDLKGNAYIDKDLYCETQGCHSKQFVINWDDGSITINCSSGLAWINRTTLQLVQYPHH